MEKKAHLYFGIVGCGMIARYHAIAIAKTDRCSLLGACPVRKPSVRKLAVSPLKAMKPCWPIPLGARSGNSASADPKGISAAYHIREYQNFVCHVLDGEEWMLDAAQGRMPLSVILGVYESSRTGKAVKL